MEGPATPHEWHVTHHHTSHIISHVTSDSPLLYLYEPQYTYCIVRHSRTNVTEFQYMSCSHILTLNTGTVHTRAIIHEYSVPFFSTGIICSSRTFWFGLLYYFRYPYYHSVHQYYKTEFRYIPLCVVWYISAPWCTSAICNRIPVHVVKLSIPLSLNLSQSITVHTRGHILSPFTTILLY